MYCKYKGNSEERSRNHRWRGKAVSVTHSECLSATLFMHHAMRMRRIIRPSLSYLALTYFSTLSHKRHEWGRGGGGATEHKLCVLVFSTTLYETCILVFM
jgi:hypothetical protein